TPARVNRPGTLPKFEPVAPTRCRDQPPEPGGVTLDLLPQLANLCLQVLSLRRPLRTPYRGQDLLLGHAVARTSSQCEKELAFEWRDVHLMPVHDQRT